MALPAADISHVMGEPAQQPIRVYASLESAASAAERAELLLAEIDRTRALERSVFALFSPTGSGYVNYVATETLEYLTRGDCASAAIQYSVLPSALSLGKVHLATHQTRIVVNGIVQRLLAMPAERRPRFYLFGESLGSQVSQEMFEGQGLSGPGRHRAGRRAVDRHPGGHRVADRDRRRLGHHPDRRSCSRRRASSPGASGIGPGCPTPTAQVPIPVAAERGRPDPEVRGRRCCGVAPDGSARTRPDRTAPRAAPAGCR